MINDKTNDITWKELSTEHIVTDRWIDFRKTSYEMPDGTELGPFYTYSRTNFAIILPTDEAGNYICVQQFRQGIRRVTTEFPAGGIEPEEVIRAMERARIEGQDPQSLPLDSRPYCEAAFRCAQRELREETGYVSDDWDFMIAIPSNATICDDYAYIFRARNCRREASQDLDPSEFLHVKAVPGEELERCIHCGDFPQALHIMAYMMDKAGCRG